MLSELLLILVFLLGWYQQGLQRSGLEQKQPVQLIRGHTFNCMAICIYRFGPPLCFLLAVGVVQFSIIFVGEITKAAYQIVVLVVAYFLRRVVLGFVRRRRQLSPILVAIAAIIIPFIIVIAIIDFFRLIAIFNLFVFQLLDLVS